jgi:hypothetical protein
LREEIDKASMFEEIVGKSRSLQTVLSLILRLLRRDSSVLVTGETGTGKELVGLGHSQAFAPRMTAGDYDLTGLLAPGHTAFMGGLGWLSFGHPVLSASSL